MILTSISVLLLAAVCGGVNVDTHQGIVSGTTLSVDDREILQFLGIPFAKPPVGELRFRRPQPLSDRREKPLIADTAPKGCLQHPGFNYSSWPKHLRPRYGEDCLYLSVWTPELSGNRSVFVWIHGGGYTTWESLPNYNGRALAAVGDVVVVAIQYRLGFLGFARLDAEQVPGNNGLWDQQEALRWIRNNIAAFGGNPDSITIAGESAGGASVSFHLLNDDSSALFQRGMLMSGCAFNQWAIIPDPGAAENLYRGMAKELGCGQQETFALLSCLRGKSEAQFQTFVDRHYNPTFIPILFAPTVDGHFLTQTPKQAVAEGKIARKDIVIGNTNQEMGFLVKAMSMMISGSTDPSADRQMNASITTEMMDGVSEFFPHYPQRLSERARRLVRLLTVSHGLLDSEQHLKRVTDTMGDYLIYCGVNAFADDVRRIHDNVFYYSFDHRPTNSFMGFPSTPWITGAMHTDDLSFLFAWPLAHQHLRDSMTEDEVRLARKFIGDIAEFARTGTPGDPNWSRFSLDKKEVFHYGLKSYLQSGGVRREECVFWNQILPMVNDSTEEERQSRRSPDEL